MKIKWVLLLKISLGSSALIFQVCFKGLADYKIPQIKITSQSVKLLKNACSNRAKNSFPNIFSAFWKIFKNFKNWVPITDGTLLYTSIYLSNWYMFNAIRSHFDYLSHSSWFWSWQYSNLVVSFEINEALNSNLSKLSLLQSIYSNISFLNWIWFKNREFSEIPAYF